MLRLVRPALEHLPSYAAALKTGWSPDNTRPEAAGEQLQAIERDPAAFVAGLEDRGAKGPPITLPDGSQVPRLPGFRRWMWDDGFCGSIGLRWQPGTAALPPHVLSHCGYAVVPWKRRRGYATEALRLLLPEARALGLPWVDLTTDAGNLASRRVILANGGVLVERFAEPSAHGGGEGLRFRINLDPASA
jgi:predicted acetyltransferase